MPNFLENVFDELQKAAARVVLREVRGEEFVSVTGRELLAMIGQARSFLRQAGLQAGERCALLGPNSIQWAALDLALMAEGAIVVALYSRQAAAELVAMMKDCAPKFLFVSDAALGSAVADAWTDGPVRTTFAEVFEKTSGGKSIAGGPNPRK